MKLKIIENIIKSFHEVCINLSEVEDISFRKIEWNQLNRFQCFYSINIKDIEVLVDIELMNAMVDAIVDEQKFPEPNNIIDEISIEGAEYIFNQVLKDLNIVEDFKINIKSDFNLEGVKTYYKFSIDNIDGYICINVK